MVIVGTGTLKRGHGPFRCYNCTGFGHIANKCPTPALEEEQSGTAQYSRQNLNRGPNDQNGSAEEDGTRLKKEADEDDKNGCKPEQAQDCLADCSNDYTQ